MAVDAGHVVVFDGVCNLCAHSVAFILAHERDHAIRFATWQSDSGRVLLHGFGFDPGDLMTFVFIKGGTVHVRSDAALEVAHHLRLPWRMLRVLRIVPRRLRDSIYNLIARNRYRWFGKRASCLAPTPQLRSRFLGE